MKLVSKAALGAALAFGSLSLTIAMPAYAKDKKPKEAPKAEGFKLNITKELQSKMNPAIAAYKAKDWNALKAEVATLEPLATTPDDKYQVNDLKLSAGIGLNDTLMQSQAVDGMMATGLVQPDRIAQYHYFSGKWAYERKEYPRAETEFKAAAAAGMNTSDLHLNLARLYADAKRPAEASATMAKAAAAEKAAGKTVPESWYNFGFTQAFNARSMPEFVQWSTGMLRDYPSADYWRVLLQNYRALQRNIDKANMPSAINIDLYRLMKASGALAGEDDVFDYAYAANEAGLPLEAKGVLDGWKASGKALNADMTELNGKVAVRAAGDQKALAGVSGTSSDVADAVLVIGAGDYAKAATIYQGVIAKGGMKDADETQMRYGIALALSGQKDAAKAAFQAVKGQRANLAQYWIVFVDVPPQAAKPLTTGQ